MKTTFNTVAAYVKTHLLISGIAAVVIIGGGYYIYGKVHGTAVTPTYTLAQVEKGTISSSVSASGQVSASNEVSINAKVSGEVTYVAVKEGQTVTAGTLIAQIDNTTAQSAVTKAQQSLTSANISYQKAVQQSQSSLTTDQNAVLTAQVNLDKAYSDGYNAVANAYVDIPSVIIGLNNIYYKDGNSPYFSDQSAVTYAGESALTYKNNAGVVFDQAKNNYNTNFAQYKLASSTDPSSVSSLIQQTTALVTQFQNTLNGTYNAIDYINLHITSSSKPAQIATDENAVNASLSKINSDASSLLNAVSNIQSAKQALINAQTSISNSQATLNGVDTLDIQSAKLSLAQQQTALQDAKDNLSDYSIVAPFDGVVAKLDVQKGDTASGAVATVITKDQVADISLNEVDAKDVKVGQKATLTFDALSDVTLTGTVINVDTLGTVTQGVVSYAVKIAFDTQNDEVKSGMTVTASIITNSKLDTLVVPSSAVKTSGDVSYVQVLDGAGLTGSSSATTITTDASPRSVEVTVGISDDTSVEILSGLTEGETIITKTSTTSTTKTTTTARTGSATSLLGGSTRTAGGRPGAF